MIYVQAFVFAGIVCAVAQFFLMSTKLGFMTVFSIVMAFGTIFGMLGWFGPMVNFALMGCIMTIMGLCNQFYDSILLLLHGTFFNFIAFIILLCCIVGFGVFCGLKAQVSGERR